MFSLQKEKVGDIKNAHFTLKCRLELEKCLLWKRPFPFVTCIYMNIRFSKNIFGHFFSVVWMGKKLLFNFYPPIKPTILSFSSQGFHAGSHSLGSTEENTNKCVVISLLSWGGSKYDILENENWRNDMGSSLMCCISFYKLYIKKFP